jgi:uncharacterized repeat protein (TIGR01451 family)
VFGLALVLLMASSPAGAHQNPPGCNTNGLGTDIQKSATVIENGDVVTYTITLSNGAAPSCDVTNVQIRGFCPDATGQPTVLTKVFPPIPSLPAPTATFQVGTFQCTVTVNPGVVTAIARETVSGLLHDNPVFDDALSVQKDVSVIISSAPPPPPPPPPPQRIPTMSQWAMGAFVVFMVLAAAWVMRKRGLA